MSSNREMSIEEALVANLFCTQMVAQMVAPLSAKHIKLWNSAFDVLKKAFAEIEQKTA